jgi:hypothetical protein
MALASALRIELGVVVVVAIVATALVACQHVLYITTYELDELVKIVPSIRRGSL